MRETIWDQFEHAEEWEPHFRLSFARLRLVDGTTSRTLFLMKRKAPDGSWQYRRRTKEEFRRSFDSWR